MMVFTGIHQPSNRDLEGTVLDRTLDIESIDHALKTARSIRRKLDFDRSVPMSMINECIDIAVQAPVSLAGENWRFLVVTDPDIKGNVAKLYSQVLIELSDERKIELKPSHKALIGRLHEIPCMIFVCAIGQPGDSLSRQTAFFGSILPAAWSLMLALRARNLGSTWTTLLSSRSDEIRQLLGVPEDVTIPVMLPVGFMKDAVLKVANRLPSEDVTYKNRWGKRFHV
jgi:nitroreductase